MENVEKSNLCIAGFRLFSACWREWLKWSIWFFVVFAILGVVIYDPATMAALDKFQDEQASHSLVAHDQLDVLSKIHEARVNHQPLTQEQTDALNKIQADQANQKKETQEQFRTLRNIVAPKLWVIPLALLFMFVQGYAYMVLFLQKPPQVGVPVFSVGRFFYMVWKGLQKILLLIAIGAVCFGVPMILGIMLAKMKLGLGFVSVILGVAGFLFFYYAILKYALVVPLAVTGANPVLKTSWDMTRGNWWRIFGNVLIFAIFILVIAVVMHLVEKAIIQFLMVSAPSIFGTATETPPVAHFTAADVIAFFSVFPRHVQSGIAPYVGVVFSVLNACIFSGVGKAFQCAILRVLYQEQQIKPF